MKITVDGLWIAGRPLNSSESVTVLVNYFGETPRLLPANPNAPEWREVFIFDEAGVYVLCDKQHSRIVSVNFVWNINEVPYPPIKAFTGKLRLNGILLTDEMTAKQLPVSGPITLQKIVAGRYAVELASHHLSLRLARPRSKVGKRLGIPKLAYLEFSFSAGVMPDNILVERLQRN